MLNITTSSTQIIHLYVLPINHLCVYVETGKRRKEEERGRDRKSRIKTRKEKEKEGGKMRMVNVLLCKKKMVPEARKSLVSAAKYFITDKHKI